MAGLDEISVEFLSEEGRSWLIKKYFKCMYDFCESVEGLEWTFIVPGWKGNMEISEGFIY